MAEINVTNIKPSDIRNLEELLKKFTEGMLANQQDVSPELADDLSDDQKLIVYEYQFIRKFQEGPLQPAVAGLGPIHADEGVPKGQTIEITGEGLLKTVAVLFGDLVATPSGQPSDTKVMVLVPESATAGQLAVLTSTGGVATRNVEIIIHS